MLSARNELFCLQLATTETTLLFNDTIRQEKMLIYT